MYVLIAQSYLFFTPWTVANQDPLSMGFSRQKYLSGLPFPSPEDLPSLGIKPQSLPDYRQILYCLSHQGSQHLLEHSLKPCTRLMAFPNISHLSYCPHLLSWGIGSRTWGGYQKPLILYTQVPRWALCIQDSASTDSSKGGESGTVVFIEKHPNTNGPLQFKPVLFKGQLKLNSHNPVVSLLFCLIMNKLRFENTLPA